MRKHVAGLAFVMAFGFPAFAAAAHQTSAKLELFEPTSLNGTELAAGTYRLSWTGSGTDVAVTVTKEGKVVAETRGKLVEMGHKAQDDAVVTKKDTAGHAKLEEVRFGGKKSELVFSAS